MGQGPEPCGGSGQDQQSGGRCGAPPTTLLVLSTAPTRFRTLSHSIKSLILSNLADTRLGFLLRPNSISEKLNWLIKTVFISNHEITKNNPGKPFFYIIFEEVLQRLLVATVFIFLGSGLV